MAWPARGILSKAILNHLQKGQEYEISKVTVKMADDFELTEKERTEKTDIAKRVKFDVQIRWAVSQLRKARLLENIENKTGVFKITERGLDEQRSGPASINHSYLLKNFPEYKEWIQSAKNIIKINKKTDKDKPREKFGLVAYIDILGIKEFWTNSDSQNLPVKWKMLTKKFQKILNSTFDKKEVTFNSFSDTMIITVENKNTEYLLKRFGMAAWNVIAESIKHDIPIRGCFSIGKFFQEGNFFIGDAITEAARYYELPQWIGITASPSAYIRIEKLNKKKSSIFTYYHKYSVPLKHHLEQEAWAIKWPELYEAMDVIQDKQSTDILDIIDEKLEKITNIDIVLKWRNTRKFYNDILNNSINE